MDPETVKLLLSGKSELLQLLNNTLAKTVLEDLKKSLVAELTKDSAWRWNPGHGLLVCIPQDNRYSCINRGSVEYLKKHVRPDTRKAGESDPSAAPPLQKRPYLWLLGQLLHYELPFALNEVDASNIIVAALEKGDLKQPEALRQRAQKLKVAHDQKSLEAGHEQRIHRKATPNFFVEIPKLSDVLNENQLAVTPEQSDGETEEADLGLDQTSNVDENCSASEPEQFERETSDDEPNNDDGSEDEQISEHLETPLTEHHRFMDADYQDSESEESDSSVTPRPNNNTATFAHRPAKKSRSAPTSKSRHESNAQTRDVPATQPNGKSRRTSSFTPLPTDNTASDVEDGSQSDDASKIQILERKKTGKLQRRPVPTAEGPNAASISGRSVYSLEPSDERPAEVRHVSKRQQRASTTPSTVDENLATVRASTPSTTRGGSVLARKETAVQLNPKPPPKRTLPRRVVAIHPSIKSDNQPEKRTKRDSQKESSQTLENPEEQSEEEMQEDSPAGNDTAPDPKKKKTKVRSSPIGSPPDKALPTRLRRAPASTADALPDNEHTSSTKSSAWIWPTFPVSGNPSKLHGLEALEAAMVEAASMSERLSARTKILLDGRKTEAEQVRMCGDRRPPNANPPEVAPCYRVPLEPLKNGTANWLPQRPQPLPLPPALADLGSQPSKPKKRKSDVAVEESDDLVNTEKKKKTAGITASEINATTEVVEEANGKVKNKPSGSNIFQSRTQDLVRQTSRHLPGKAVIHEESSLAAVLDKDPGTQKLKKRKILRALDGPRAPFAFRSPFRNGDELDHEEIRGTQGEQVVLKRKK